MCRHAHTNNTVIYMISGKSQKMGKKKKTMKQLKKKVPGELSNSNKCETRPKRMAHLAKAIPTPLRKK